ncbi:uncharacterized protein LOC108023316 [Drosophila biarmipes]|uniref:uncharacterized protein LOC108023316 n=1 Tax=Drosophila biarmipes TaxID=125945 RepID=UPI0007E8A99B|nr:uncharacterized protein LOC108023316 [Drosophila biarmipes]
MAFLPLSLMLLLLLVCASVSSVPMLYKLNPEEKYEADLVPVSSTVIPLTVLEVSYGEGGKPSEEYKAAYLRKLRKQVLQRADQGKQNQSQNDGDDEAPTVLALSDLPALAAAPADADALITVKSQQLEKAKVKAV